MKLFDNIEEKLEEIRTHKFYKPCVSALKKKYDEFIREPIPVTTFKDFMTVF